MIDSFITQSNFQNNKSQATMAEISKFNIQITYKIAKITNYKNQISNKSQILSTKLQTNSKAQYPMNKLAKSQITNTNFLNSKSQTTNYIQNS
jgi:hypothetical protein